MFPAGAGVDQVCGLLRQAGCRLAGGRLRDAVRSRLLDGVAGEGSTGVAVHIGALAADDLARQFFCGLAAQLCRLAGSVHPHIGDGFIADGHRHGHIAQAALGRSRIGARRIDGFCRAGGRRAGGTAPPGQSKATHGHHGGNGHAADRQRQFAALLLGCCRGSGCRLLLGRLGSGSLFCFGLAGSFLGGSLLCRTLLGADAGQFFLFFLGGLAAGSFLRFPLGLLFLTALLGLRFEQEGGLVALLHVLHRLHRRGHALGAVLRRGLHRHCAGHQPHGAVVGRGGGLGRFHPHGLVRCGLLRHGRCCRFCRRGRLRHRFQGEVQRVGFLFAQAGKLPQGELLFQRGVIPCVFQAFRQGFLRFGGFLAVGVRLSPHWALRLSVGVIFLRGGRAAGAGHGHGVALRVDHLRLALGVEDGFQRLPHHGGAVVALGRVRCAGFEHDLGQTAFGVGRGRQGRAGKPLGLGPFPAGRGDGLGVGRVKRHPVVVQQLVHHKAQRVNVHIAGVLFTPEDLRGHIVHGARTGGSAGGRAGDARHAEIAQLEVLGLRDEDVGGLDVAVDDVVPLANFQRLAQVHAQLDDLAAGEGVVLLQVAGDGGEQLHADEDVPAHAVFVGEHLVVLVAHDVAVALELAHEGDLPVELLDVIPEVGGSAVHVHAVGQDLVQLPLAGRDGHGLERTGVHGVELIPAFDLEHPAVAARADEALDAPLAEERLIPLVILVFHADPSSYFSACSAVLGQNARQTAADRAKAPNFLVFPQIARH